MTNINIYSEETRNRDPFRSLDLSPSQRNSFEIVRKKTPLQGHHLVSLYNTIRFFFVKVNILNYAYFLFYLPTTVGSKSTKIDRGTYFPATDSLKKVLKESSSH